MFPSVKRLKLLRKRVFQLFIFLLPTQLAYHFWPDWSFIFGIRVDYLSPAIYLTDIVLLLLVTLLLLGRKVDRKNIVISLFFLAFAFLNTLLAARQGPAIYKWVKIFVFVVFSLLVARQRDFDFDKWLAKPLKASLLLVSAIGVFQFIFQKTLGGPFYFLGERTFSSSTPGIALFSIFGKQYLRAYSTFSHPNSFAAFLLLSLIILYFRKKELKRRDLLVIGASSVALLLTYSRAVIIVAALLAALWYFGREKFLNKVKVNLVLTAGLVVSLSMPLLGQHLLKTGNYGLAIGERLALAKASGEIFSKRPIFGVGFSNFVVLLPESSLKTQHIWDLQPVHNIFLLTLSELGVLGLILVFVAGARLFKTDDKALVYSLLAIVLTGLIDHYWLTLQQNVLLLFTIAGLSLRTSFDLS